MSNLLNFKKGHTVTHYWAFFHQILKNSQKLAFIVYRLIDAALIGNFSMIPSFFLKTTKF